MINQSFCTLLYRYFVDKRREEEVDWSGGAMTDDKATRSDSGSGSP